MCSFCHARPASQSARCCCVVSGVGVDVGVVQLSIVNATAATTPIRDLIASPPYGKWSPASNCGSRSTCCGFTSERRPQADKLLSRGLAADREELIYRLKDISYYRLSGYLHPFRQTGSDEGREGTHLRVVWDRYCFDRRLRV